MKKHFLFLASLVLGLGQLFADNVTFSLAELRATLPSSNTKVAVPYTWKVSPYHVTATIAKQDGTEGVLSIAQTTNFKNYTITVAVAGEGKLNKVTFSGTTSKFGNATASIGTYASGTWTAEEGTSTNSVTFTTTNDFPITKFVVDYTPDSGYTPDVPSAATMGAPIEAIAIDNINSYTGSEPYVYNKANMTYYALNNLGQYEEYGIFSEVSTLKVAGGGVTEIESIKSTNNAYINLDYIPKANSKAICTINAETGADWKAIYGCGYNQNGWKDRFCFFTTNATINLGGETGNRNAMRYGEKIVTVLDAVAGKMDIFEADGTTLIGTITDSPKTADCKTPLYVFAQNKDVPGGGKQTDCYNMLTTLYGLKLYEGDVLVMDLVPAVNGEGKGGLKDKLTGTFYGSANSGEFQLSADGQAVASSAGISVYEGKRVKLTTDNHEYKYQNGEWLDCGAMALEEIADTTPSYKDMRNWKTNDGHMSIFSGFTYDGTTNVIDPYVGTGGHEPYMFQIPTLAGQDYNWSFVYSGSVYDSWHSTQFHAFVTNAYDLGMTATGDAIGGDIIGIAEAFPFAGVENKPYSIDFTAKQSNETLVVQFGDVNDGKNFWFKFANLKVSKYIYPLAYEQIDFVAQDDNKYTPLEYIESTGAVRENAFTTTYKAKASTEVDIKFNLYSNNGWAAVFCGRNGSDAGNGISLYKNGGANKFGYFVGGYRNDDFADFPGFNQDITVEASLSGMVVNGGEKVNTNQTSFSSSSRGISMFANPEWDNPIRGRIYYMTIKEEGTTVYDFQPVMRHDGAYGYYDRKTATFVQPAQGNWNGYNFATVEGESYIYFTSEPRTVFVGFTEKFEPTVINTEGAAFTWKSSNTDVATVAADGTVTGVARGTAIITATDTNSDWVASYTLTVEPATVAANNVEVWDGSSDAIVGSIKWGGDSYKPAYTMTFDSGMGYNGDYFNHVFGTPAEDESNKAWYETDFTMTNTPGAVWSYNSDVLPNSWPGNMGEVYVRRYFKAEGELPAQLYMPAPHDDAPCEYYINGTLVWSRTGYEPGVDGWYEGEVVKLNAEQRALIKNDGSVNVFAYHVHQNWGGRYADGGIYGNSMADNSPSKSFEGNDNLKRLANAVAQAESVAGFPADVLEYCQKATVCLQDVNRAYDVIRFELRKLLAPRHNFEFASAEPVDGGEYWIYNVGAGQFLAGGNDWGTHTSLDYQISQWPMVLHTNTSGANRYSIQTNLPNGTRGNNDWLGHNGYVDCGGVDHASVNWAWEFQAVGNGNYRIINSQNSGDGIYLGMTEDFRYQVDTNKSGADNLYNQWKLITRAQLEALAETATAATPADVSFYITQNSFSQNEFNGNDKGAAQADFSEAEAKWERNAGNIGSWKNNASNGDFIFEMFNTAGIGKVYLKQTLEGLPAGQYIVECTGYYRDGSYNDAIAGNARQLAYLYAGSENNKVLLPSILDYANKAAGMGNLNNPDNMIPDAVGQASRFFEYGNYTVQAPVVNVGAAGTLEIGIFRDAEDVKAEDWIVVDNFRLYRVGQVATETVTVGEALYATYVAPVDVDFTGAEVSAFAAQTMDGYVHLEPVTTVPAGAAVVVKADAAGTYDVNLTTGAALGTNNDLIAATADVTADGTQYILAKQGEAVGFAPATPTTTIVAGKGYLVISAPVKPFYPFGEDDATGINNVEFAGENAPIYNVAGQRIGKMQKGINIVGGKKVLK